MVLLCFTGSLKMAEWWLTYLARWFCVDSQSAGFGDLLEQRSYFSFARQFVAI